MPRPLRIEYPGAWYHVMNRGRRKELIFFEDDDYMIFLKTLKETHRKFNIAIHAYVLMPNHYHLLVNTPKGNLSRAIRHLNGVYTQRLNKKMKMDGSLFRGRYKAIVIEKEGYLLEVMRYIHRNPIKSGLENTLGEYRWSSYIDYVHGLSDKKWLYKAETLKCFGKYEKESIRALEAFVSKEVPGNLKKRLDGINWPVYLGGEKFKKTIEGIIKGKEINVREVPQAAKELRLEKVLEKNKIDRLLVINQELLRSKQTRKNAKRRRAVIYVLKEYTEMGNKDIAEKIGGITDSSISWQYLKAIDEVDKKEGCYKMVKEVLKTVNP